MSKRIKEKIFSLLVILFISCQTSKIATADLKMNTQYNSRYRESIKAFSGKLNNSEYSELIKMIETELDASIPAGKSVLINFDQKALNCISQHVPENRIAVIDNGIRLSSSISANNNAIDFFVYTNDSFSKEIYDRKPNFILDSGFFYNNVFTIHENCRAFLIVKPNGEFYKYYGEDYYTVAEKFLKKE